MRAARRYLADHPGGAAKTGARLARHSGFRLDERDQGGWEYAGERVRIAHNISPGREVQNFKARLVDGRHPHSPLAARRARAENPDPGVIFRMGDAGLGRLVA